VKPSDRTFERLRLYARIDFWGFCNYYDFEFFQKRKFFKDIAILFQSVVDEYKKGNALTVSVSLPPRSGKSYITSLFAAYWLAQFPELSVMRNSCTATLYQKFSYDTRDIIKSQKFKDVFPETKLQSDRQNLDGWSLETSKQVGYFGAGVGGTIIGFGANLAITDDLYKSMQDALSTTTNKFIKLWKESAHDSRKEKYCPEIYIGTRWAKDDIIGDAVESGFINSQISIPALINGKSFCEDVKTTDEYLLIKERTSKSTFEAEYMQNPLDVEGLLIPKHTIKFIDTSIIDKKDVSFSFAVGDPADTGGDKYSIPFIDVIIKDSSFACYVRDVIHSTIGIAANTERIIQKMSDNRTENIYIESNGVGLAAVLLLKKQITSGAQIRAFPSSTNKEVRILSNYEFIQKYFIFDSVKYNSDQEYRLFIDDLTSYSKEGDNKNKKDAIDVLSSAANILKIKFNKHLYG